MTQDTKYLTSNQSALMYAIYGAISRFKTNRMLTPNGQAIALYAQSLFPDLGTVDASEITSFVKSPEAGELITREPLSNLKQSLDEAILSTSNYPVLSAALGFVKVFEY